VESLFATLGQAHTKRFRPKGEVQTFAQIDPKKMVPYDVDTEDFGSVLLNYRKGTHANLAVSQVAAGWKCSLYLGIYGTEGSVRWDLEHPNEIVVGRRDEPNQVLQRATAGFTEDIAGFTDYPGGHPEGFADAHKMYYRAFYQHVASGRRGEPLFATAADGHEEIRVCEAILRSHSGRRWVRLG
jgi:predicted dehydrogenase